MTAKQPTFTSSFLAVLLMAVFVFQPCVMAQEQPSVGVLTDKELQQLVEINAALEDQIQTARIQCKYLLYIGVTREIPAANVIKALDSLDEKVATGGFQALNDTLSQLLAFAKSSPLRGGAKWCDAEIIKDEGRIRNRLWREGVLIRDSAFDGDREVQFQVDSKQANVFTGRSNWSMITTDTLRGSYPSLNLEWMLRANRERRIERVGESHRLRINSEDGSNFVIVDQSTGLTTKSGIYAAGELFQISEFLRRREYPGGIVFPGLTVECELRSGLVKSLAVYAVEKAEFNVAVDDSDFSVAVPADVVVVRDNSTRGRKTEKLVAATSNALSDAAIFREVHSPKRFGWMSLMSLALGIGALLVAGAAWRVASRR